jgi:hypothetical protein
VGNVILNFNVFFLAQWEEYHTGTLNTNNGYFGLTEGQLAQIATMISCAVDRGMWSLVVPGFGMEAKYVLLVPMTIITCSLAVQSTIRVLFTTRQSKIPKADYGVKEVRECEEQSEELRRRVYWTTTYLADTSVRGIIAAKF